MLPRDKLQVVETLQTKGHTVAMMGDVATDSAALRQADLEIAFSGPTQLGNEDVENADIVIQDPSFGLIPFALRECRRMTINICKAALLYLSSRVGLALVCLIGMMVNGKLPLS